MTGGGKSASGRTRPSPLLPAAILAFVAVAADFCATGIWTIQQDEKGVVLTFGRHSRSLEPGIQFTLPYPFETVKRINTHETRKMPVGFRLVEGLDPSGATANESEWLTGDTNVIDIQMMIHYVIRDPVSYLFRVGEGEANFLVRKCVESVLTEKVATMRVDDVLTTGKVEIQAEARRAGQELLDRMGAGITILSANIQEVAPPERAKAAFNDVTRAKADKERLRQEAEGYILDREPRSRALANRIMEQARIYESTQVAEAAGRAAGFTALCSEYERAKGITRTRLLLETFERVLARVQKIIVALDSDGKARVRVVR